MNRIKLLLTVALVVISLTGCSKDSDDKGGDGKSGGVTFDIFAEQKALKIVNEQGQPIAGAEIMIGLSGNVSQSAADGTFKLPATWVNAEHITLSAKGFIRATYMSRLPVAQTFVLRKETNREPSFELSGVTSGYKIVNGDDKIDFSIVAAALSTEDLFHFDMNMIISQFLDTIEAAGQKIQIPSNVTLPKQKENYFIGVTLDKPKYRVYFNTPGQKKVFASRGTFPFKKVVGELRAGKQFSELMNFFTISGGSIRDVSIESKNQTLDIPITDLTFSQKRSVKSTQVGKDESLMGAAFTELNGVYIPSDIKNFVAGSANSLAVMDGPSKVLSVLKRTKELNTLKGISRLSVVLSDFTDGVSPQHLPIMEDPRIMSPNTVQVQKIQSIDNVREVMTYAAMSKVKKEKRDGLLYETLTPVWEVYAPSWVDRIEIPNWPGESIPTGGMRWSVSVAGTIGSGKVDQGLDLGPSVLQNVTHVTNSAADF